ncbi:MAG TPA: protease complex subunit PrcB family protein [Thermoanaerobaculia bacterium]|nr:protease complex subunit PrcB family protein [Thermoanaerobaculia bacterium]
MKYPLRLSLRPAALLVAALLAGCDGDVIVDPDDEGPVRFETLYQSQFSDIDDSGEEIVRSSSEWRRVWDAIGADRPLPSVNFDRDMVAVVAIGERPDGCYDVEIRDIEVDFGVIEVEVDLIEPGSNCGCSDVIVQPVHAVVLDRINAPVDFNYERVVLSCR